MRVATLGLTGAITRTTLFRRDWLSDSGMRPGFPRHQQPAGDFALWFTPPELRNILRMNTRTGRPCGNSRFVEVKERITGRILRRRNLGQRDKVCVAATQNSAHSAAVAVISEQPFHLTVENGEITLHNVPNDVIINDRIAMD